MSQEPGGPPRGQWSKSRIAYLVIGIVIVIIGLFLILR